MKIHCVSCRKQSSFSFVWPLSSLYSVRSLPVGSVLKDSVGHRVFDRTQPTTSIHLYFSGIRSSSHSSTKSLSKPECLLVQFLFQSSFSFLFYWSSWIAISFLVFSVFVLQIRVQSDDHAVSFLCKCFVFFSLCLLCILFWESMSKLIHLPSICAHT